MSFGFGGNIFGIPPTKKLEVVVEEIVGNQKNVGEDSMIEYYTIDLNSYYYEVRNIAKKILKITKSETIEEAYSKLEPYRDDLIKNNIHVIHDENLSFRGYLSYAIKEKKVNGEYFMVAFKDPNTTINNEKVPPLVNKDNEIIIEQPKAQKKEEVIIIKPETIISEKKYNTSILPLFAFVALAGLIIINIS